MRLRRPPDSLFGRLALLFIGVLLISHIAWFALMHLERSQMQARYAVDEAAFLVEAVRQHVARTPGQPLPARVRLVAPGDAAQAPPSDDGTPVPLRHFAEDVRERMPAGTDVRISPAHPPTLWVRGPGDARWIVVPVQPLRPAHSLDRLVPTWFLIIFSAAVMAALVAAWQLQRPLRALAQAVARFGGGLPVPPVPERGPRELRLLTHGFNQMVQEVARTENDRAVMLAGVAHDLKTPLARLRLRAEMMDDEKTRDGVVRDVASMAHIVDQFLAFAHDDADRSEPVPVDQQVARIVHNRVTGLVGGAAGARDKDGGNGTGGARETSDTRDANDVRGGNDARGAGDPRGASDTRNANAARSADDMRDASDTHDAGNPRGVGGTDDDTRNASALQTRLEAGPDFLLPTATLERVLSNLLDNASAYGAPPVVVETRRTASGFELSVYDHGQGIAAPDRVRASRPFVRLDPARGGNGHSGLGLAIVERLVRRAGGDWQVGNRDGVGLCVRMSFAFGVIRGEEQG